MKKWIDFFRKSPLFLLAVLLFAYLPGLRTDAADLPVRQTDVTTPQSDNILVELEGTFSSETKENILNRLNEIRKEAYNLGYVDSYVPLKWSSELEQVTMIRAAEAIVNRDHYRPNGDICFEFNDLHPSMYNWGENLAWHTYSKSNALMEGIELWYDEKAECYEQGDTDGAGHYLNMIDPAFEYTAVSCFSLAPSSNEDCVFTNSIAQQLIASDSDLDQSKGETGDCIQVIEVQKSTAELAEITGSSILEPGDQMEVDAMVLIDYEDGFDYYTNVIRAAVHSDLTWSSSDPSIAPITADGVITGSAPGTVTITASINGLGSMSRELTVKHTHHYSYSDLGDGTHHKICSSCHESAVEKHSYKSSKCTLCGSTFETPELKSISNTASGVKLTWSKVDLADGYYIYRKNSEDKWKRIAETASCNFTDKEAVSGKKNVYTVKAFNADTTSGYDKTGKSIYYLAAPSLKTPKCQNGSLKFSWSKVAGAKSYYVYLKTSDGWKRLSEVSDTSYSYSKVSSGKKYTYTVRAINGSNKSSYVSSGKTGLYLSRPALDTIKKTSRKVKLSWKSVKGAESYYIYRKTSGGSWKKIGTSDKLSYTDSSSLKKGTTYIYTVKAVKGSTTSSYNSTGLKIKY